MKKGRFLGVGVGPGGKGLLPVAALQALQQADVILAPRAEHVHDSVAKQCLRELDIPWERLVEFVYDMNGKHTDTLHRYRHLATQIAEQLSEGKDVAYLTIGETLTYSTYGYTLQALLDVMPDVSHRTFPGISSYSAVAASTGWPLGQGKERILILPCPESEEDLISDIGSHDIVVLMKIGHRLPWVLDVLNRLNIAEHCAFAHRIGFDDELVSARVSDLAPGTSAGYLSTMLIRKGPSEAVEQ